MRRSELNQGGVANASRDALRIPASHPASPRRPHPRAQKPTVLLLGPYRQALAVARSLHRAGMHVVFGRPQGPANSLEHSRDVDAVWVHPPVKSGQTFVSALEQYCYGQTPPDYLFPLGDEELALLALLGPLGLPATVVSAAPQLLETCQDKERLLQLASARGIRTEPWETVVDAAALRAAVARFGYPVVIKANSAGGKDGGEAAAFVGGKARFLTQESDLAKLLSAHTFPAVGVLLQRQAQGPRHNIYFAAWQGALRGVAETIALRTDRLDGTGLGVEGISVALTPALLEQTRNLVEELNYTGVGCAQFLVDPRDGSSCFLEINARLGANCASITACGLDLPRLFVELMHGDIPVQPPAAIGRRYAWLGGDLQGLADSLRGRLIGSRAALRWVGQMLWTQLRANDHITFSLRDPLPAVQLVTRRLAGACLAALRFSVR